MTTITKSLQKWISTVSRAQKRTMSSSEISTALRPLYFSVHPDLFGQYPSERAINENSLQILSSFIETVKSDKQPRETTLTFYLKQKTTSNDELKFVKIQLQRERNIRKAVSSILTSCNLPTTYVDSLATKQNFKELDKPHMQPQNMYGGHYSDFVDVNAMEQDAKSVIDNQHLSRWLDKNVAHAREKLQKCQPVRDEIERLKEEISETLGIEKIVLDCGWNIRHYRGCLASFQALAHHYPSDMEILRGRTLVFGSDTGISLDGHVLLNSGEVRHNWLDFVKKIPKEEEVLKTVPNFEKAVSRVLRDIKVVRRKFQPKTIAKQYENNLKRLTTSLSDHQGRHGYPKHWPKSLSNYELVVETEAGPLMVSPTGQFIVPSSCPSFLLVNFISDNLQEAESLNTHYQKHKHEEKHLAALCLQKLNLAALEKDDNVNPDHMIECCSNLLKNVGKLEPLMGKSRLYVANYYSIMSDGQICIPWNWKY